MTQRKIFVVDDHPLVREWLGNLIRQEADLEVCGEAESASEALEKIAATEPDIAIVDISLADSSGIDLIRSLGSLPRPVATIVLSMHDEAIYAERVLRLGARGYIMKRETAKRVIAAIRKVLGGEVYLSDRLTAVFAQKFLSGGVPQGLSLDRLSNRELEVFQLLGQGYETRQIAETMHVQIKTVQEFCARIKIKLGLGSANELLREAIRWHESH
jgi:DNA-binding NarL/FixJ family response regulator